MRTTACLLVLLCAAPGVSAQEMIEWSPTRRLAKEDFQGRVPVQAVNSSLSFLHIETSWECVVGELIASARATFDPTRSWWRTSYGNIWGSAGDRTSASRAQMPSTAASSCAAGTHSCAKPMRCASFPPSRSPVSM